MQVHLVNPSDLSFGIAVITPRWLFVLAESTPRKWGDPVITDETLEPLDFDRIKPGDVVGIGIHTSTARRGYAIGREARKRGASVVFGGIHATLYPEEARELGEAHAVVKGDGDAVWSQVLDDLAAGTTREFYDGGRIDGDEFKKARWELIDRDRYMWASVQTVRGCPKHCSFCSVWRTDGQEPRQRGVDQVVNEVVELRRMGFRFIALADDNFYPVTLTDLETANRREDKSRYEELKAVRDERFELMDKLSQLPDDLVFFTQITMEAAEDPAFLDAMKAANIKGALVGVESVTEEGLKDVYKGFNESGESLVTRLRLFREHGLHVLGSFIFGLPSDGLDTFSATAALAHEADITFAQFLTLTPFPGTVDFNKWEQDLGEKAPRVEGVPITRYWLIPPHARPKIFSPHPRMTADEIRVNTQGVWDRFYSVRSVWERSRCVKSLRSRVAFVLISKLYRQMYANTGIATDSARVKRSTQWARMLARPCQRFFAASPLPDLLAPTASNDPQVGPAAGPA